MPCQLCSNDSLELVSSKDAKSSEPLNVSLCSTCGLIQQNFIPDEETLNRYYHHEYRQDYKGTYRPKSKHVYRAGKTALQRLNFLKSAGIKAGRLLDVGAGGGEFTYLAGKTGFAASGVEPNKGYSDYARKEYHCDIKTGNLNNITGQYDVITLFHVLEHLPSPQQAFNQAYQLLSKEGYLLIEVPWIEARDASPHNIYFKAHLYYFSIDTLMAAASQHFDAIMIDTGSNLKILFRAKQIPVKIRLPDTTSVAKIRTRLHQKGWLEYLFQGQGLLKPIKKLVERMRERKAGVYRPREILDQFLPISPPGRPVPVL
ncbi:class I SAM-dependent methyltransferase [Endozoicomonas sp.]|uniref:class I SAM-dependent methyltransferase n=1 Tax=Endozoicomonas sp. TaxID=1892382 RepID=UPI003AF70C63